MQDFGLLAHHAIAATEFLSLRVPVVTPTVGRLPFVAVGPKFRGRHGGRGTGRNIPQYLTLGTGAVGSLPLTWLGSDSSFDNSNEEYRIWLELEASRLN